MNTLDINSSVLEKTRGCDEDNNLNESQLELLYAQEEEWRERMKHTDLEALFEQLNELVPQEIEIDVEAAKFDYLMKKYLA
ncbi:hypothetical protein [uncultured Capnocytophaga sp.]|jgi:hypothetical protein|uniref:hypothetical protein n=1 Tax=uncultured Capnocytophaga sp. TaxID=159273 RepID=UPI002611B5BF|nr:hypothetical protein [uncultured Capnocytophaga sp.]